MHPLITKPLEHLTAEDVRSAIAQQLPEGQHVEFKAAPSGGAVTPIVDANGRFTPKFKASLLKEVCAFANTGGGTLVIGLEEGASRPATATSILPVSNCKQLAEDARLVVRDCIKPSITVCHSVGVVTEKDGTSGVVVIRVPSSLLAPHRREMKDHALECFLRRADRSERMEMYEIQDLTLRVGRNIDRVETAFTGSRASFEEWSNEPDVARKLKRRVAFGITAVPVSVDFSYERVHGEPGLELRGPEWTFGVAGRKVTLNGLTGRHQPRVFLRSTRVKDRSQEYAISMALHGNGVVENCAAFAKAETKSLATLQGSVLLAHLCDTLDLAHRFRVSRGAPDCEYGLEICVRSAMPKWFLATIGYQDHIGQYPEGIAPTPHVDFPRYSATSVQSFPEVVKSFWLDMVDYLGDDNADERSLDFQTDRWA